MDSTLRGGGVRSVINDRAETGFTTASLVCTDRTRRVPREPNGLCFGEAGSLMVWP